MADLFVGVDPGKSGGIASINWDGMPSSVDKMPATERDIWELVRSLNSGHPDGYYVKAVIEKVGPMPKQGISSTWKFAQNYGTLRMALIAAGIPLESVAPGVWQRALGCLSRGDKNVTKRKAQELFPQVERITHATADALLLAEWLRRRENGRCEP